MQPLVAYNSVMDLFLYLFVFSYTYYTGIQNTVITLMLWEEQMV